MTTKSPPSMCGAKVGLCLPRNRVAAVTARRPRTMSSASMTIQSRVRSPGFGLYVDTVVDHLPYECAKPDARPIPDRSDRFVVGAAGVHGHNSDQDYSSVPTGS